ncbi:hypothetical protein RCL1_008111 [Eukaryota sp. TZLM3-RCL]
MFSPAHKVPRLSSVEDSEHHLSLNDDTTEILSVTQVAINSAYEGACTVLSFSEVDTWNKLKLNLFFGHYSNTSSFFYEDTRILFFKDLESVDLQILSDFLTPYYYEVAVQDDIIVAASTVTLRLAAKKQKTDRNFKFDKQLSQSLLKTWFKSGSITFKIVVSWSKDSHKTMKKEDSRRKISVCDLKVLHPKLFLSLQQWSLWVDLYHKGKIDNLYQIPPQISQFVQLLPPEPLLLRRHIDNSSNVLCCSSILVRQFVQRNPNLVYGLPNEDLCVKVTDIFTKHSWHTAINNSVKQRVIY